MLLRQRLVVQILGVMSMWLVEMSWGSRRGEGVGAVGAGGVSGVGLGDGRW